jgi:hypothetical protein
LENTEGAIKMDNPEKLAIQGIQLVKTKKNKAKTQHNRLEHHYTQADANDINKT